jgi:hypothetical protein
MNITSSEPISFSSPTIRHDGWTGEAMAKFLETLAETGIVTDACDVACKSRQTAYALRRRDPLFAQAWELALGNARDRLADTLLARSLEGNVEQIVKDGEIVAEKHFIDNRLGLAILKRLDRLAEFPGAGRGPGQRGNAASQRLDSGLRRKTAECDWDIAISALRTGDADEIAAALVMLRGDETDETDTPEFEAECSDTDDFERVWRDWRSGEWKTDFPPPPGFDGYEEDDWGMDGYRRDLSDAELAALIAAGIADPDEGRNSRSLADDQSERDRFFASLLDDERLEPLEVQDRVGKEHPKTGDYRDQHPGDEVVDRRPAQEGAHQHDGHRQAEQGIDQEQPIAGHDFPLSSSIDPASPERIMERGGEQEGGGGCGQLVHAGELDQQPQREQSQQEDADADDGVPAEQDGGVARP